MSQPHIISLKPDPETDIASLQIADSSSMAISLPYDVFEIILSHLDGISLLSCSCVCKRWNSMCETYISHGGIYFWKRKCHRELRLVEIEDCLSGSFDENWFAVYKTAHVEKTLPARTVRSHRFCLDPRFIRYKTSVHVLGRMLVVCQGPLISMYDIMTRTKLGQCQPGNFNVFSAIIKKKTHIVADLQTEDEQCDILVMMCGARTVTHLAVATEQTILTEGPALHPIASRTTLIQAYNLVCENTQHVTLLGVKRLLGVCYTITCSRSSSLTVDRAKDCNTNTNRRQVMHGIKASTISKPGLNHKVSVAGIDYTPKILGLDGRLLCKQFIDDRQPDEISGTAYTAKTIHYGDEVIPVIASVQSSEEDGKYIQLWTLELD